MTCWFASRLARIGRDLGGQVMESRLDLGDLSRGRFGLPAEEGDVSHHGYERMEIPGRTIRSSSMSSDS